MAATCDCTDGSMKVRAAYDSLVCYHMECLDFNQMRLQTAFTQRITCRPG